VITSTLLTLLVIPTVYETLADARDWMGARLGVSGAHAHAQGSKGSREDLLNPLHPLNP
jgi:hypothetical protein